MPAELLVADLPDDLRLEPAQPRRMADRIVGRAAVEPSVSFVQDRELGQEGFPDLGERGKPAGDLSPAHDLPQQRLAGQGFIPQADHVPPPGQPGRPNRYYNPMLRTISASFEIFPGSITPADLAPTQIGVSIQGPGSQFNAVTCKLAPTQPQLFTISPRPYLEASAALVDRGLTINGLGFGLVQGLGSVTLGGTNLPVTTWTDRQIVVTVPQGLAAGPYQLMVKADNGQTMVNGLTFHILGAGYNPTVYEVDGNIATVDLGPNQYNKIQDALEAAAVDPEALVVVLPGLPGIWNPDGTYFENVVIHSPVKLQGVGPGGVYEDAVPTQVPGSTISGLGFGGDTELANQWRTLVNDLQQGAGWDGNQVIYEGQVVYILAQDGQFTPNYKAAIDGFTIEGGDQMGFPNNLNEIWGLTHRCSTQCDQSGWRDLCQCLCPSSPDHQQCAAKQWWCIWWCHSPGHSSPHSCQQFQPKCDNQP